MIKLYSYWRSSAAYRVRIALELKGLKYEIETVDLKQAEQRSDSYLSINPQGRVPALTIDGHVVTQSLSIIEYLEERYPEPALLPPDPLGRAYARSLAQQVACEIHPLDNLCVLMYLKKRMGAPEFVRMEWYRHWVMRGFSALERTLRERASKGKFCCGNTVGLADICLVPQVYNARRFACDLSEFPLIVSVDAACAELDAFKSAAPERQPDSMASA